MSSIWDVLDPADWFPEDPVVRCGWYFLCLFQSDPTKDPYFPFCEWDDLHTGEASRNATWTLARHIEGGLAQICILQADYAEDTWQYDLGEFYKAAWPKLVGLVWEGPR